MLIKDFPTTSQFFAFENIQNYRNLSWKTRKGHRLFDSLSTKTRGCFPLPLNLSCYNFFEQ